MIRNRSLLFFLVVLAATAPAQVVPSVFVDGAFDGNWNLSSTNEPSLNGSTIRFQQIDRNTGPSLINSLGNPEFSSLLCPPFSQKTEYYSAVYDFQGGGQIYACTNGGRLFGRYSHSTGNGRGFLEIFETNKGPNPTWRGQILRDGGDGNFDNMNAVYGGGGIATPLARITDDAISILFSDPPAGKTLASGSLEDFVAVVEFNLDEATAANGFVRLVLLNGAQEIEESAKVPVAGSEPTRQTQIEILDALIPEGTGQVRLRADLLGPANQVIRSSALLTYAYAAAPVTLTAAPTRLVFGASVSNPAKIEQTILLTRTGSGVFTDFTAETVGESPWLETLDPDHGEVTNTESALVTVVVNPQGLAAGTYLEVVRITSADGNIDIPVTLVVASQGPLLFLTKTGLRFETRQNQGSSTAGNVSVRNLGSAGSVVSWSARVLRGTGLVNLNPGAGVSQPGAASNLAVTVSAVGTDRLGPNYALIEVSDPNALNSPQYISVVVDVNAANSPTIPLPSPAGFYFTGVQGGAQPASQALTVHVSRATNANFTATPVTNDGRTWLAVNPASGTASTATPGRIDVIVSTAGLAAGVYRGVVNVAIGSTVRATKITLVVQQPTVQAAPARAAVGCTPRQAAIVETSLIDSFSVPAAFPANLVARMFDDCGDPRGDGSVVATFSNGDPPLSLYPDSRAGDYSATWVPGATAAQTTVTLVGTVGNLTPSTLSIVGGVNPNAAPPPVIASGGFIHNLNPELGAPLAPGTVTQVFGSNLAVTAEAAETVPLPTSYRGVEAVIGPYSAPIYYASPGQLTIQVPFELEARSYSSVILVNGVPSVPEPVNLVPVQPGTVEFTDGRLVAQHGDFSLVTPESPARPNEVLTLYLVGMGATTPPVPSGRAAPGNPLATANVRPQVTIDGYNAEILFAGLTPGGVGLYQINLRVPPSVRTGSVDVVITQGGVAANETDLVVGP